MVRKKIADEALGAEESGMQIANVESDQVSLAETAAINTEMKVTSMENTITSETGSSIKRASFSPLNPGAVRTEQNSMDLIMDVALDLSVELGRTSLPVRDILQLGPGSILELDKLAGEPVDIMVNGKLIARGEVVVVDDNFGIRVTEIANRNERISGVA